MPDTWSIVNPRPEVRLMMHDSEVSGDILLGGCGGVRGELFSDKGLFINLMEAVLRCMVRPMVKLGQFEWLEVGE